MAQLTWLGEDDLHGGGAGPSFTEAFGGIKFPKGKPVEVRTHGFVQKALNNPYFEVSDPDDVDDAPQAEKKNKGGRPSKAEIAAREAEEKAAREAEEKAEADRVAAAKLAGDQQSAQNTAYAQARSGTPAYIPPPAHET